MTIGWTIIAFAGLTCLPSFADAQGLTWHSGPDRLVGTPDAAFAPQHLAQQYDPPKLPPDIVAPERPRGARHQRGVAPPIDIAPLDPLPPEPEPAPAAEAPAPPTPPAPIEKSDLAEWCAQAANSKAPMCRNIGSPKVQR
jgi:hypothetical protein